MEQELSLMRQRSEKTLRQMREESVFQRTERIKRETVEFCKNYSMEL